jgi:hypothetical protein
MLTSLPHILANKSWTLMATGIGNLIMALILALGGSAGVVAIDDAMPEDKPSIEERLTAKSEKLDVKLELIDACREWDNCTVDNATLDEYGLHVSEKLARINSCLADYENCTLDDLKKEHDVDKANMTFEEKVENRTSRIADGLQMVEACRNVDDCYVDAETLDHIEEKLEKQSDRLERCSQDLDKCEEKHKERKHKGMKKMRHKVRKHMDEQETV